MTKYSLKNICLGIGIGLILASMANINAAPKRMTIDEIRRAAESYNLIVVDAKELIKKQPEQQDNNEAQGKQTEPVKNQETNESKPILIVIEAGATSEGIAEMLLNNKLISSKQEFLSRLKELNKESKVQIGSFTISTGASLDKIIEIITSSPK